MSRASFYQDLDDLFGSPTGKVVKDLDDLAASMEPAATNWDIEEPPASSHRRLQVFSDSQPTIDVDSQPIFSDSHETR